MILRGDFVHCGGFYGKSGGSALRFHANIPLYKTHIGCGSTKDFERKCGQGNADYYSKHLLTYASSMNHENTQSNIIFNESLTHGSLVFCPSHLEAVREIQSTDEYDDLEDSLYGASKIRAGDIVHTFKDNKGERSYFPYKLVISCTSADDKVCTLFFSCWSLYCVVAFHSGSLFSSGIRVSYYPVVNTKQVMAGEF